MKVLVACEESQTVCKAFRKRGHEAYSCDIQEPSGGHPEWHILGDALKAIQPWMFGHPEQKATCLWLKGLPQLAPTKNVREEMLQLPQRLREKNHWCSPCPDRSRIRSKTYPGIAAAMAEQWGVLPCG